MIASAHPSDQLSLDAFREFGAEAVTDNRLVAEKSDIVFIAVKPGVVRSVLDDVKTISDRGQLFVSIAMGITLRDIEGSLSSEARVIRVMPNTPSIVKAGASVLVRGSRATDEDAALIKSMLGSIGTCDEISDEYLMDPVTALR